MSIYGYCSISSFTVKDEQSFRYSKHLLVYCLSFQMILNSEWIHHCFHLVLFTINYLFPFFLLVLHQSDLSSFSYWLHSCLQSFFQYQYWTLPNFQQVLTGFTSQTIPTNHHQSHSQSQIQTIWRPISRLKLTLHPLKRIATPHCYIQNYPAHSSLLVPLTT